MARLDNPKALRHLAGIAKKKLIYSHAVPCDGNWDESDPLKVTKEGRFEVIEI